MESVLSGMCSEGLSGREGEYLEMVSVFLPKLGWSSDGGGWVCSGPCYSLCNFSILLHDLLSSIFLTKPDRNLGLGLELRSIHCKSCQGWRTGMMAALSKGDLLMLCQISLSAGQER